MAGDFFFEADKQAGLERRFSRRAQADEVICRQQRVQEVAKKLGLSLTSTTMKGWRRKIREAPEGSILKYMEKGTRKIVKDMEPFGLQIVGKALFAQVTWQRII